MRERMKKKKNMIIGGLLAVVFLLSVGYAAFATNLNISGTANTSSWIIKITNIREKTHTGGADTENTSFTDLSATFSSTLTQPGDSVTYEVTVENQGNIDASLKKVTKTFTQNKYIDVTYSGLLEGQMLYKQGQTGSTAVMEVTVTFKDIEIESLTDTITSNITISLDFEQEGNNVDTTTKYLVTYDSQGGTPIESRYASYTENRLGTATPKKLGYTFAGWFSEIGGSGVQALPAIAYSDLISEENHDPLVLYAYWVPSMYTIKYENSSVKTSSYSWTATNIARSAPYLDGYDFNGWYTGPNGAGLKIKSSMSVSDVVQAIYGKNNDVAGGADGRQVTLYASWTEKIFTFEYKSIEDEVLRPSQTIRWTDTIVLPEPPTKEGYTFDCWRTSKPKSNGTPRGTIVTSGETLESLGFDDYNDEPITLYAYWTQNE